MYLYWYILFQIHINTCKNPWPAEESPDEADEGALHHPAEVAEAVDEAGHPGALGPTSSLTNLNLFLK